jgi:hypothetical protein
MKSVSQAIDRPYLVAVPDPLWTAAAWAKPDGGHRRGHCWPHGCSLTKPLQATDSLDDPVCRPPVGNTNGRSDPVHLLRCLLRAPSVDDAKASSPARVEAELAHPTRSVRLMSLARWIRNVNAPKEHSPNAADAEDLVPDRCRLRLRSRGETVRPSQDPSDPHGISDRA